MDPDRHHLHAYTVQRAVDDWLCEGLDRRSAQTVTLNRHIYGGTSEIMKTIIARDMTGLRA